MFNSVAVGRSHRCLSSVLSSTHNGKTLIGDIFVHYHCEHRNGLFVVLTQGSGNPQPTGKLLYSVAFQNDISQVSSCTIN